MFRIDKSTAENYGGIADKGVVCNKGFDIQIVLIKSYDPEFYGRGCGEGLVYNCKCGAPQSIQYFFSGRDGNSREVSSLCVCALTLTRIKVRSVGALERCRRTGNLDDWIVTFLGNLC